MRRHHVVAAVAAVGLALTTAGVATAVPAEVAREKASYEIVDGIADPYLYPGDYGFEQCFDEEGNPRTYALYDGTLKQSVTYVYTPSQAAFDAGEPGSSMTARGLTQYKGLFDRDYSGIAIYELRPKSGVGRGSLTATVNADGTTTTVSTMQFSYEWFDITTGESTGDYYNVDMTFTEVHDADGTLISSTAEGTNDGTCYLYD